MERLSYPSPYHDPKSIELHPSFATKCACVNAFPSSEERERAIQMASIAKLMYKNYLNPAVFHAILSPFPKGSIHLMPSPEELEIVLPAGLKVQAFKNGDEIIIGIRGTELTGTTEVLIKNLFADLGIGRTKRDEDILETLNTTFKRIQVTYGHKIPPVVERLVEKAVTGRIKGMTESERAMGLASRAVSAVVEGVSSGLKLGGGIGVSLGLGVLAFTPLGATIAATAGLLTAAATTGTSVVAKLGSLFSTSSATAYDGFSVFKNYVGAITTYIQSLRSFGLILDAHEVSIVGHSLGGNLAGVVGLHEGCQIDNIFSFNGPGVKEDDSIAIYRSLGFPATHLRRAVSYFAYSASCDTIGNLFERDTSLNLLEIPTPFDGPLAHHGIAPLLETLLQSGVITIINTPPPHFERNPEILLLEDGELNPTGESND